MVCWLLLLVCWLVDLFVGWVGWLFGLLLSLVVGCLVCCFSWWLVGWLACCFSCWLVGLFVALIVARLFGFLLYLLVGCLAGCVCIV